MKFANKYELFEAVTNGRVETFVAKDLTSNARVLLHIFEAPEKKPDQPTVQWVLESFRKVAPSPPGLVVETGRYSGTTYAYLVTKLPDSAALQRWAQSYEAHVKETQEIAIPAQSTSRGDSAINKDLSQANKPPAEEPTPMPSSNPPGDITAAFSGLASPANLRPEAKTSGVTDLEGINFGPEQIEPRREPGEFTRQFFSGSPEVLKSPAPNAPAKLAEEASFPPHRAVTRISAETQDAPKAKAPEPQSSTPIPSGGTLTANSSPDPGSFTALFRSSFKSESKPSPESVGAARKSDDANAGDFTDFFRGPFDGERPPETPQITPKALETPRGTAPGEFTRVFGSGKESPFASAHPLQSPGEDTRRERGAFTQSFPEAGQSSAPPPMNVPSQTREPIAPKSEISPLSKESGWTAPASLPAEPSAASFIEPIAPKSTVSSTLREAEPSQPAGATHVFSAVGIRLGSSPPPLQGGPSEYTRIISGGMTQNPAGEAPGFKFPSAPAVPPMPKVAVPPPPKFAPPAPPPVPKPKPSFLPLIIILNVLLVVAILLIVYFSMKH